MIPPILWVAFAFVGGAIIGSFLNVVIYRVPRGESVATPRSRCPGCGTAIRPADNIPMVSWIVLRGRCRHCGEAISARYVVVEAATALTWSAFAAWALITPGALAILPLLLVLASAGIALTVIDIQHHRLPDAIVLPLYPVTVLGLVVAGLLAGAFPLGSTLAGCAVWLGTIGLIWLVTRGRGMGLGDVKLSPILGATLGWLSLGSAVVGLVAAFLSGALVGVILLAAKRAQRRSAIPFGPFLLLGAASAVFLGPAISAAYLGITGIS
jgi:leader peptidase (prepilin peptidase)/N-methyltransferase